MSDEVWRAALRVAVDALQFYAKGGGDGGARARAVLEAEVQDEVARVRALERVAEAARPLQHGIALWFDEDPDGASMAMVDVAMRQVAEQVMPVAKALAALDGKGSNDE